MQDNHFLIGLGGTGGRVLRSFRKAIHQNFKHESPEGVRLGYLYVDSSDDLMRLDDQTWKILGTNVQLPQSSQLKISGLNLLDVVENVSSYPNIAPWLGNREYFRSMIRSADSANVLGGQKRRLGRFLFASQATEYRSRVQQIVRELVVGNKTSVTFHFVLGLAGGTGSGSIIDAISQTRELFPSSDNRIIIYALLPDKNPKPNRAGPNYFANGYAALLELNALDVGRYFPVDVSGTHKERLDQKDPFNLCYLFTDENEDKNGVDIDTELPDILASFLYQKIVNAKDLHWTGDGDAIKRQERFEIGPQAEEKEKAPASGKPERTRRFFTFGTKQIAYPEEEIREYLTYTFARQAALQLLFDNFSESVGFVDQPKNQSFSEFVRAPETMRNWLLSDDHLILSDGILSDERSSKKWKPIPKFWSDLTPSVKEHVRDTLANDKSRWLAELQLTMNAHYEQNYRDMGVKRFYEVKRGDVRDYCREIRRTIETTLFGDWINGTRSLAEISRLLVSLLGALSERRESIDELVTRSGAEETQASAQVNQNTQNWSRLNFFGRLLGHDVSLFDAQSEALRRLYLTRTMGEGFRFARQLLAEVIGEITDLANEAARAASTITSSNSIFTTAVAERLRDPGQSNIQGQVVRFYDPAVVKDFARSLVRNEDQQNLQARAVRSAISSKLGDTQTFAGFNARISEQIFRDILEKTSDENVIVAHDAVIGTDRYRERVLRVSVLERLQKKYGGNRDALRSYVSQIVSRAKSQLVFNRQEEQLFVPGNESLSPMFRYSTIIIPEGKDQADFREVLVEEFKGAKTGPGEIVSNPERPNEITIINVTSAFPARFVQDVKFLRERYEARVNSSDATQARFELHTEGDGEQFPSLFLRQITKNEVLPVLLVGNAIGMIQVLEDPVTGSQGTYFVSTDAAGLEYPPVRLGKDFSEAADSIDVITFDALETNVKAKLADGFRHRAERAALYENVKSVVAGVIAAKTNPLDPVRQAYIAADRSVESMLELTT